jgi:hypothetical protein
MWKIPGVDLNYAPLAVFHVTNLVHGHQQGAQARQELSALADSLARSVRSSPSKTELRSGLKRQVERFIGPAVKYWYDESQNLNTGAAPWYASLLKTITSEAHTIAKYEGPVLAIQFLVSIAASATLCNSL